MGNAVSSGNSHRGKRRPQQQQQRWNWDFKDGQAKIKPRAAAKKQTKRPLFLKQPSDNYNWWIFNPDPPSERRR